MIRSENICKSFDSTVALKEISFNVEESELFGIIGPDGAGKTTLFRTIATLLIPDSGSMTVMGLDTVKDYKELRNHIGYMPGRFSLYQDLTVSENLNFYATVFGTSIKENYHLIEEIYSHIEPFKKRLAGKLSGGMKQKLALCCALIHAPRLMILDEPTTGVDAVSRSEFWEMLKNLKKENITVIVSTPYMDEADKCDRVALIENGSILKTAKPEDIPSEFNSTLHAISASEKYKLILLLKDCESVETVNPFGDSVHITYAKNIVDKNLDKYLRENDLKDVRIREIKPGIEDTFLKLMNKDG